MKTKALIYVFFTALILSIGCSKDDENDNETTGYLQFKTLNPISSSMKSVGILKSTESNPALVGDTTETILTSLNFCIGDVWVSQGEVKAGNPDNLEWIRLTDVTNHELKLFENYLFAAKELPAGTYKSIKITLKNIWYRHVELVSDPAVKYELLETMGSSFDPCDENDTSWVKPNYFSDDGNHNLNDSGVFEVVSAGEKIGGFTIESGKTAIVSWRLFGGVTEPIINYLFDLNGNLEWDCGIDDIEEVDPPELEYMWDFLVEYE